MKKSLAVSILIHAALLMIIGAAIMIPSPEKKTEPIKIRILPTAAAVSEEEPLPAAAPEAARKPDLEAAPAKEALRKPLKPIEQPRDPLPRTAPAVQTKEPDTSPQPPRTPPAAESSKEAARTHTEPKETAQSKEAAEPARLDPKIKEGYLQYLRQTIDERKVYPRNAKRLRQTGTVTVRFTLHSDGTIANVSIVNSSGFELLDQAAADLMSDIAKVRPVPKELGTEPIVFSLPIHYTLR